MNSDRRFYIAQNLYTLQQQIINGWLAAAVYFKGSRIEDVIKVPWKRRKSSACFIWLFSQYSWWWWCSSRASCPRMSVDIIIRDKLWPMPKHGSMLLYVHRNRKAHYCMRTESSGRSPRLSHSSWTLTIFIQNDYFLFRIWAPQGAAMPVRSLLLKSRKGWLVTYLVLIPHVPPGSCL